MELEIGPIGYIARVVNVKKTANSVEVAFIFFGTRKKIIHFSTIGKKSHLFETAEKLSKGDEVFATSDDYEIMDIKMHNAIKRFYVRFIKSNIDNFKRYLRYS